MKSNLLTILIIISVLLIAGWFTYKALNPEENAKNSEAARVLVGDEETSVTNYTDLDGNPIKLQEYAGSVRVVNSWATWSPFSKDELNNLEKLASENDVTVIAINRAEPAAKAKSYLNKIGNFENVVFVLDPEDRFYESVEGYAMPETIFYNNSGQIIKHKRGVMNYEEMQQYFEQTVSSSED